MLRYGKWHKFAFGLGDQTMMNNFCEKDRNSICKLPLYLPTQYNERVVLPTVCPTKGLDPAHCARPLFRTFI